MTKTITITITGFPWEAGAKITVTGLPQGEIQVATLKEAEEIFRSEDYFRAIGVFIFRFSQLEHLIKSALARYLNLRDDRFDVIVGPYDFAMLCTVAEKTIKLDFDPQFDQAISSILNDCRKLNNVRNRVAHGRWSIEGSRHASRQSLKAEMHFEKPEELLKAADEVTIVMDRLNKIWLGGLREYPT